MILFFRENGYTTRRVVALVSQKEIKMCTDNPFSKLTESQKESLRKFGFVNVSGLPVRHPDNKITIIRSDVRWFGCHTGNNGMTAIHTLRGQVFLREGYVQKENANEYFALLREICPNGRGAHVPCSNGEKIVDAICQHGIRIPSSVLIMRRLVNPDETFEGRISADAFDGLPEPKTQVA
jgi:hypothetical protein